MAAIALAFLAGVLACQLLPALPSPHWSWGLLPALAVLWRGGFGPRLGAALAAGFLWSLLVAHAGADQALPQAWEGRDLVLEGRIAELPEPRARGVRFVFAAEAVVIDGRSQAWPRRVRLSWYRGAPPALAVGERWRLTVRLKRPHGFANPGGMDYERWLWQRAIVATGYVRQRGDNERLDGPGWRHGVERWRQQVRSALREALAERGFADVLQALVIGDRSAMDGDRWTVLTATGTNHLMAISGLHVGLVAGLAFWLGRALWRLVPVLPLYLPAPKAGAWAGLIAALSYAALAGFSIPTQRALIMVAVAMLALLASRPLAPAQGLALALLLVLLWDPMAATSAGFWLSFAAVAVIFYTMSARVRPRGWWWRWGRVQWVLALALAPLLLVWFQQASLVAPLANLVAVPWMSLLVIPPALLGTLLLAAWPAAGAWLLAVADQAMGALWWLLERLAAWPVAVWRQPLAEWWLLLAAVVGVAWLLAPRGVPGRVLGVLWLLPVLLVAAPRPLPGEAWLHVLDVGQGLAAVVETRNHRLVFDTGPRFGSDFDAGEAVVLPFLRQRGIAGLDVLIVSHGDNDHIGGAASLLRELPVDRLLSSVPERLPGARACRAGQRWQWDGVVFELLNPDAAMARRGGNDASCVLRVSNRAGALLLSGDIERAAERQLLTERAESLAADVLLAPHHGSLTSSTPAFIAAVRPRWVVFATGYRNRFGFPRPAVVARYREQGIIPLDTATSGMISVRLGRDGLQAPRAYRREQRRYWRQAFD